MGRTFASRLPFLFAVAILAAGLGDPVVESMANTGIFGGHYADNDHLGVVPTLVAGTIIALEFLALRLLDVWRRWTNGSRDAFIDVAKDIGRGSVGRDLPLVFGFQLVALFAMESAEQILAGGKPLGGTAWLGGPVLLSLTVHALFGGLCRCALGACMRASLRTLASLVRTVVRFIWLVIVRASSAAFQLDRRAASIARTQAPHVRELGGRAPPLLQTLVPSYIS